MSKKQNKMADNELPFDPTDDDNWGEYLDDDPVLEEIGQDIEYTKDDIEYDKVLSFLIKITQKRMEMDALLEDCESQLGEERMENILDKANFMERSELEAAIVLQKKIVKEELGVVEATIGLRRGLSTIKI